MVIEYAALAPLAASPSLMLDYLDLGDDERRNVRRRRERIC